MRIGTRGSQLALYQANTVAALLRQRTDVETEIIVIKTSGDRLADASLSEIGGKRLFVKEIEDALLGGEVDLAVHSSKDMPAVLPSGLELGAVLPREDARDAVVLPGAPDPFASLSEVVAHLGEAARIGTSSVRRVAQLIPLFPGAHFLPIRGNLDTRLRKLDANEFDAIVLASAGLRRLGFVHRISLPLPAAHCVPAPGQGIIAVEIRSDDERSRERASHLNDSAAAAALDAERAVVIRLGGGCQMPIGAYAAGDTDTLHLDAVVISLDGARSTRAAASGAASGAAALGTRVAEQLLAQGAGDILAEVERAHGSVRGIQP